jgi:hypothetical protein
MAPACIGRGLLLFVFGVLAPYVPLIIGPDAYAAHGHGNGSGREGHS